MGTYLSRHLQNALAALGQLSRQPVATLLTIGVIGIALALPASLQLLVQGGQRFASGWSDIRDFSVYLKPGTDLEVARKLARALASHPGVSDTRVIEADTALAEFGRDPAFGEALKALRQNPLPHTLVVRPDADAAPAALDALKAELAAKPEVDLVQLDTQWLMRLAAILDLVRRGIWIAAVLLVAAVIFIVGNTIRLDIQNRRQEIEVSKLLGATDAFVRRPFLYIGFWYGLLGGTVALLLLAGALLLLRGPMQRLLQLYGTDFAGFGLSPDTALLVLGAGLASGWAGAWLAVGRHLSAIEPQV
ncbi:Cell division protein FtsX [Gammaproteobacteria bacterium]|nr:cell division protein [Gammaproteobacteria bacterium]QOJ32738.1 MAG: cell division protein [Gammaproteobacteria bacterium]CAG0943794.1 Cell division protein FtsX [Gammaproteobacteria bacterium]